VTKVQLRNAWFQVHKWIGLLLAIILIPLSLTGSMLVWDEPLDRLLEPSHYTASGPAALPASAYVETARRALPAGSKIVSVRIGEGPVMVTATPPKPSGMRGPALRLAAWIDPASGALIDSGLTISPLLRWAHIFHGSLQIPGTGRAVVGWLGVAMTLSSLTGLWLWWPLTGSISEYPPAASVVVVAPFAAIEAPPTAVPPFVVVSVPDSAYGVSGCGAVNVGVTGADLLQPAVNRTSPTIRCRNSTSIASKRNLTLS